MSSARFQPSRWSPVLARAVLWAGLVVWTSAAPAETQSIWELTPYRIQILLATGPAAELTPELEADLRADLVTQVDTLVGAAWEVAVVNPVDLAPALRRAMIWEFEALTIESLPEESLQFDKVILLVISADPNAYRVTARELDVRTEVWSSPVRVSVWQTAKLRDAAFQAVWRAFAPLAQLATVEDKQVSLRLRASGFSVRDKTFSPAKAGDLFRPVIRYNNREGKPLRITVVPWTFLTVEEVTRAELKCKLHTGLRSPLSGRRRGRIEQLALAVIPPRQPTRLTLTSRTDPEQVLPGYDVYAHPPDSKTTTLLGRTDRHGSLTIDPADHPLRVLLVKNGGELLARLPLVPGMPAEISAPIANDDQRLRAEGFIKGFEEQLVDLVTRREVLLAQIRTRMAAEQYDEAESLIRQLRRLKTRDELGRSLGQEENRLVSEDAAVQRKIDVMFHDTRTLLQQHLDPETVEQLARELLEARTTRRTAGS